MSNNKYYEPVLQKMISSSSCFYGPGTTRGMKHLSGTVGKAVLSRSRRGLRAILSISIVIVSLQLSLIIIKTFSFLLEQEKQLIQVNAQAYPSLQTNGAFQVYHYSAQSPLPPSQELVRENMKNVQGKEVDHDYAFNKFVLVLDFWERMINVQSGLRRLVQLGVDSGFTVVEPFVYESKVSHRYAFPEHFEEKNMTPQTASLYFRTEDLYVTNRYISHEQFRKKILISDYHKLRWSHKPTRTFPEPKARFIIQAVVYIDWTKSKRAENRPFRWCKGNIPTQKLQKSTLGWRLGPSIYAQRMLCLSSSATMLPSKFTAKLFQDMFAFVSNGTRQVPQNCGKCVTLAFMNYRKHAFTGFVSHTGAMPFKQKTPPLEVGQEPQRLGEQVRSRLLRGKPYVAIQIRTGKAFVLLEHYERLLTSKGKPFMKHAAFKDWLKSCTENLVREARVVARQLGRKAVFYIASDMYNDGWKGGEKCPPVVKEALEVAKRFLDKELKHVYWFKPSDFGIKQDAMGISGLADAAVCLKADRFMFTRPSNFGRWVHEQRTLVNDGAQTVKVNCMDPRFVGS